MAVKILLWVLLALVLLAVAGGVWLFRFGAARSFKMKKMPGLDDSVTPAHGSFAEKCQQQERARDWLRAQPMLEDVEITARDGLKLHGYFLPAAQPTGKTVLAVHGYRCDGLREWGFYADFYHRCGYNLLMVDDRGHGQSEGKYIGFGCPDRLDVLCWADWLKKRFGDDCRTLLHGISMGGATVLLAGGEAQLEPSVCGIIDDCGYTSAWEEQRYQLKNSFHLPAFPLLYVADLCCRLCAGYSFRQADALAAVKNIRVPVLFIHGDADDFVPTEMGYRLYEACQAKKKLLIVRGAIHADSYLTDKLAYEAAVREFAAGIGF